MSHIFQYKMDLSAENIFSPNSFTKSLESLTRSQYFGLGLGGF